MLNIKYDQTLFHYDRALALLHGRSLVEWEKFSKKACLGIMHKTNLDLDYVEYNITLAKVVMDR